MKRTVSPLVLLLILVGGGTVLATEEVGVSTSAQGDVNRGKILYAQKCAICHGQTGRGDGPAEVFLFPKPRDLTSGTFKIRSTSTLPTDEDLFRVITEGISGTAMPGWATLKESERLALVAYVKSLAPVFAEQAATEPVRIPTAPKATPALLKVGKKFYAEAGCIKCHGASGKGDGEAAATLKDDWDNPILPTDFTIPGRMKSGNAVRDVYRALVTGIGGTPMPSYAEALSEQELWGLAYYVLSLAKQPKGKAPAETAAVTVRRVTGELPTDPNARIWRKAALQALLLRTLWARPQQVSNVRVAALHNGREIGFLLEWGDPISDQAALGMEEFADAAAIQFPLKASEPNYVMGDPESPVNIWYWRADRQTAQGAVNPPALSRSVAVENLNAAGIGTITSQPPEAQVVRGEGRWADGKWRVVIVRPFKTANPWDAQFEAGQTMMVAFAVWDGLQRDQAGQKAVSVWQRLVMEASR